MSGRRLWYFALLGVTCAACALPVDDHARALGTEQLPPALVATSIPSTTAPITTGDAASTTRPEKSTYRLWFIGGAQLQPVTRRLASGSTSQEVLAQLLAGPSSEELGAQGLRSAIPEGAIISTDVRGGVALVDLDPSFVAIPTGDQILAVGQLVLTLTGLPGVGQVRFAVDGATVQVPRADGSQAEGAVARDDYLPLTQAR
jgi:spore germination protein GerM